MWRGVVKASVIKKGSSQRRELMSVSEYMIYISSILTSEI